MGATQFSAEVASHIVKSYLYLHSEQYERADAELRLIRTDEGLPAFERYRLEAVRGVAQMVSGRHEQALSSFERLEDLANAMHSMPRVIEARIKLAGLYMMDQNFDRVASQVGQLRNIAQHSSDEVLWAEISDLESDVAEARGDRMEQLRRLFETLSHARRSGSDRSIAMVLLNLGDFYRETGNYGAALEYSKRALILAHKLGRPLFERLIRFSMGMDEIGLGHPGSGKRVVESAIQQSLASGDLYDTHDMMRQYQTALERAGDLGGALEVAHRDATVRDQLSTTVREKALLELSAKFDDERRVRQIELLERDNTIKSRNLQVQRLRQKSIVVATALIVLVCGALTWGIVRIRKINAHLLQNIKHDGLTGLLNRGYFNEYILTRQANRPFVGCLLLLGVDCLEHINEAVSYSAGDGVLSAVSKRLCGTMRDSDAFVRWASETFLVMTGPMSDAELNLTVRRLLSVINAEPVVWNGVGLECTVSIGYASFPLNGAAVDISLGGAITLVAKALRHARRQGGDRACLITLVNADDARELSAITAQFEDAASDRRVQLVETVGAMA